MAANAPQSASSFGIGISMIVFASMRTLWTTACPTWACLVWARADGGTKKAHDEHDDSSSMRILPRPCAWICTIFVGALLSIGLSKFSEIKGVDREMKVPDTRSEGFHLRRLTVWRCSRWRRARQHREVCHQHRAGPEAGGGGDGGGGVVACHTAERRRDERPEEEADAGGGEDTRLG